MGAFCAVGRGRFVCTYTREYHILPVDKVQGAGYKYAEACWGVTGENVPKQILSITSVQ